MTGPSVHQSHRLPAGGSIDRSTVYRFRFDGRQYSGHPGDTLASALIANGVRLVGRSFKYHRPRGIVTAGPEEPNALVGLRLGARHEPNTKATVVELHDGLEAFSQNCWPSLRLDVGATIQLAGSMVASGFYYKTFMWPRGFWEKVYEPLIRRSSGPGRAPVRPDPDYYEKATLHCDVLIVGAGLAGLAAALAASRTGARVVLCEEDCLLGGRLLFEREVFRDQSTDEWIREVEAELRSNANVEILLRTSVFGSYDHGVFGALERVSDHLPEPDHQPRQRLWRIVARQTVLATGGIERPLLFGDNDRPGVMLAGAVRGYVNRFAAVPGRRIVVVTNNDNGYRAARDLVAAGLRVEAVVDSRTETSNERTSARRIDSPIVRGLASRALGGHAVNALEIIGSEGTRRIDCDLVAVSGGWSPNIHLACHLGEKPVWDEAMAAFKLRDMKGSILTAGAASGIFEGGQVIASGVQAGLSAASATGFEGVPPKVPAIDSEPYGIDNRLHVPECSAKIFLDLQHDVLTTDVELASREGYGALEHVKRYTTLGMGTDQGKISQVNAISLLSHVQGKRIDAVGTTTFRPPYTPVAIGAFAGHHRGRELKPTRLPPTHGWAQAAGAVFVEAGLWLRAQYFPVGNEDWLSSAYREARAVRTSVGAADVSTLGKIDMQGPDAAALLERVYANVLATLPIGRARYGVMLREDGFVFDDGTVARLGEAHYVITTTTANAAAVLAHLEHCAQVIWPELDVAIASVTEHWAQIALAGPRSRQVLQAVADSGLDLSNSAFPFMACAATTLMGGIPGRIFRLSFSGELAYEIAVPARQGERLMSALMDAGKQHGIAPYGLEAMSILRIEKGHAAGGELNGQTTAADLGLGRMASKKKDFIGRAMSQRPALVDAGRPSLVGLRTVSPRSRLNAGAHIVPLNAPADAGSDQGHVTSTALSPVLGCWIGLALVRDGTSRIGERIRVVDPIRSLEAEAEITPACQFDPDGKRLRD